MKLWCSENQRREAEFTDGWSRVCKESAIRSLIGEQGELLLYVQRVRASAGGMNRRLGEGRRSHGRRRGLWVYWLLLAGIVSFVYVALLAPTAQTQSHHHQDTVSSLLYTFVICYCGFLSILGISFPVFVAIFFLIKVLWFLWLALSALQSLLVYADPNCRTWNHNDAWPHSRCDKWVRCNSHLFSVLQNTEGLAYEAAGNMTGEMLSPSSAARQLSDQITMAKALLVIAKESNNFNFAWELSAKIRTCQLLLSESTAQGTTISAKEAAPVIKEMSVLFSQAQDLHYDSATMIMKLKAQIQVCST